MGDACVDWGYGSGRSGSIPLAVVMTLPHLVSPSLKLVMMMFLPSNMLGSPSYKNGVRVGLMHMTIGVGQVVYRQVLRLFIFIQRHQLPAGESYLCALCVRACELWGSTSSIR